MQFMSYLIASQRHLGMLEALLNKKRRPVVDCCRGRASASFQADLGVSFGLGAGIF